MACWFGLTPGTPNPPQLRIEAAVKLVGRIKKTSCDALVTMRCADDATADVVCALLQRTFDVEAIGLHLERKRYVT